MSIRIRAFLLCALLPSLAAADERGDFVSLDRQGTANAVGLAVSGHFATDDVGPDFALRENLYGRFVDRGGFGAYGQLSFAHLVGDGESNTALGGCELGGLYVLRAGATDVILRVGIGLPTASSSLEDLFTNLMASSDRLHDQALVTPDTVWIRPGAAVRFGGEKLFAQLDAGIDIPIETSDDIDAEALFHANAGVGTTQGPVALTAELANTAFDSDELHVLHSAAVSARFVRGDLQPYAAYTVSWSFEDDVADTAHAVTAGVQATF